MWHSPKNIHYFLSSSPLCNYKEPKIIRTVKKITLNLKSTREIAIKIHSFVRDNILFGMGPIEKASQTLEKKIGSSINKANLLVAFFRAVNIPSRFHYYRIEKQIFQKIAGSDYYNNGIPTNMCSHIVPECYLNGNWIKCDLIFDVQLYKAAQYKEIKLFQDIKSIEWDGIHNVFYSKPWIKEERGILNNIDENFEQFNQELELIKQRIMEFSKLDSNQLDAFMVELYHNSNRYTERLRREYQKYQKKIIALLL